MGARDMALSDQEMKIALAIGQTMFPRDGVLGIDADDAGVAPWLDDYVARMPPFSRAQIRALLNTFEYGYGAWAGRPGATFSSVRPPERAAYLESWETAATYTQRMLYEAIRTMFVFAYVESDVVAEAIRGSTSGASEAEGASLARRTAEEAS